jgi:serine/threonine-protein kinase
MPEPPQTSDAVLDLVRKSELVDSDALAQFLSNSGPLPGTAPDTATRLVQNGILTPFQARLILQGRYRGFKLGPYKILDQIGAGGMGQVFLAEHTAMRRKVALKVLPGKLAQDRAGVERFYREARAVAALDHPNIVRAHDVGNEKGTHFLVMEFVEGRNLDEKMRSMGGRLPVGPAAGYVVQAAAGLQHAHEKGLVHRDIKPSNLLVDRSGVLKVLDMGLARFFEDETDKLTKNLDDGAVLGTADYVAPEQLVDTSGVDHRADIYSLGATLYHLVTGRPPFEGNTAQKLVAHQMKDPTPPHEINPVVPEGLSEVILGMMEKKPGERYQSMAGVVHDLLPYVAEGPTGPESGTGLPAIALAAVSQTTASLASAVLRPHASDKLPDVTDELTRIAAAKAKKKKQLAIGGLAGVVLIGGGMVAYFASRPPEAVVIPEQPSASSSDQQALQPPLLPPYVAPPPPPPPKPPPGPTVLTQQFKLAVGTKSVEDVLYTPDGKHLLTAGADNQIRVWDAATGKPVGEPLKGHTNTVRGMSLMPGGTRLLSCSADKTVRLWNLDTGAELQKYEWTAYVTAVAALPNGRRFLTAGGDGTVLLWDVDSGEVVKEYPKQSLPVYGLAVTRDGRKAVAGTWEAKRNNVKPGDDTSALPPVAVWVFDVETGKELRRTAVPASVAHVHLSPDSKLAAFGTAVGVAVWDLETGTYRPSGPDLGQRVTAAEFTRDGKFLLATGYDKHVSLFETATLRLVNKVPFDVGGPGLNIAAHPDGKRVAVVGQNGTAGVWQLPWTTWAAGPNASVPRLNTLLTGSTGTLEDALFTSDGKRVVAAGADKFVRVWDAMTGELLRAIEVPTNPRGMALLSGDRVAVTFTPEGPVRTYGLATGKLLKEFTGHPKGSTSVAVLPDGKRFLSSGHDGTVKLWDADAGSLLETFKLVQPAYGLAAVPDGKRFLVGCGDKTVRLWDVEKKAEVERLAVTSNVWRVGVTADGATAGFMDGNKLRLWNLESSDGPVFEGPKRPVDGVVFTRDGRYVLAASQDQSLYAWELATRVPVPAQKQHTNNIRAVALSPDGRYAVTSSTDMTAVVWRLPDKMVPGKK